MVKCLREALKKEQQVNIKFLIKAFNRRRAWPSTAQLFKSKKRNVFLNIPYDSKYEPLEHALCATIITYDLIPIMAKENWRQKGQIDKIVGLIKSCNYGISDLSRRDKHNMPFEHGIMFEYMQDKCCVICNDHRSVLNRLSDLSKYVLLTHKNQPSQIVKKISTWLVDNASESIPRDRLDWPPELIIMALPELSGIMKNRIRLYDVTRRVDSALFAAALQCDPEGKARDGEIWL